MNPQPSPIRSYLKLATCMLLTGLCSLFAEDAPKASSGPVIYMIGDSTMANRSLANDNPERGWGQYVSEFVLPNVQVENRATGGRSTRSFVNEKRWEKVMSTLKPGDWVVIQFGHNDQKKNKPHHYTDPDTDYRTYLISFINDTRSKGAKPVLATSIYRRWFDKTGTPKNSLGKYPQATRDVAAEMNVPLVDLHQITGTMLAEAGSEGSKALFLHFEPGEHPLFPEGKHDNSHLSEIGARAVAQSFADAVRTLDIGFPVSK